MAELTCICCPIGCKIEAEKKAGEYQLTGAACLRGEKYAVDELTAPRRIVTSIVAVADQEKYISVKTAAAVPKEAIPAILKIIKGIRVTDDIRIGDVICKDIAGTGIDLIATRHAETA